MSTQFLDLVITLLIAEERGRDGIGLGADEIAPVAHRVHRLTDGAVFEDVTFNYKSARLSSRELDRIEQDLRASNCGSVLAPPKDDVDQADVYYTIETGDGRFEQEVRERREEIADHLPTIETVIDDLVEDRTGLLHEEDDRMRNRIRQ